MAVARVAAKFGQSDLLLTPMSDTEPYTGMAGYPIDPKNWCSGPEKGKERCAHGSTMPHVIIDWDNVDAPAIDPDAIWTDWRK